MNKYTVDSKNPDTWIPKNIFLAYTGDSGLEDFYNKAVSNKYMYTTSFSLLAFLLLPFWLGMRRQFSMLAAFTGIIGLSIIVEYVFNITIPNLAFTVLGIVLAVRCRGFLLSSASQRYAQYKNERLTDEEIEMLMKDRAAKSIWLGFAGLLICFGCLFFLVVAFEMYLEHVAATS